MSKRTKKDITDVNRNIVEILGRSHNKWVNVIKKLSPRFQYAEDIVQEFYIQMLRYASDKMIREDGSLNEAYAYVILRNVFYKSRQVENQKGIKYTELEEKHYNKEDLVDEEQEAYDAICQKVEEVINTWPWYEKELFDIYFTSGMSFRQMGKEIGISWISIYNTIKELKKRLKDAIGEDYEDYINGEYKLIELQDEE